MGEPCDCSVSWLLQGLATFAGVSLIVGKVSHHAYHVDRKIMWVLGGWVLHTAVTNSIAGQLGEMYKATQGFWAALVSLMWTWVGLFWPFLRDIAYPVVFVVTRVGSFVSWRLESTPKRMFLGLDQNEDLSLDHSEFIAGAEQFADALEQPAIRDPERIEKAFQFMTHGGGDHDLISLKSFLHWWNSFELRDLFVRLDRDGSEGLDRTEVHTGLLTLQQHFGVLIDDREKMFTAMDPNGDGTSTFEDEFDPFCDDFGSWWFENSQKTLELLTSGDARRSSIHVLYQALTENGTQILDVETVSKSAKLIGTVVGSELAESSMTGYYNEMDPDGSGVGFAEFEAWCTGLSTPAATNKGPIALAMLVILVVMFLTGSKQTGAPVSHSSKATAVPMGYSRLFKATAVPVGYIIFQVSHYCPTTYLDTLLWLQLVVVPVMLSARCFRDYSYAFKKYNTAFKAAVAVAVKDGIPHTHEGPSTTKELILRMDKQDKGHHAPNQHLFRLEKQTKAEKAAEKDTEVEVCLDLLYGPKVGSDGTVDKDHGHRHSGLSASCRVWLSYWACFPLLELIGAMAIPVGARAVPELPRVYLVVLIWLQAWGLVSQLRKLVRVTTTKIQSFIVAHVPWLRSPQRALSLVDSFWTEPFTFSDHWERGGVIRSVDLKDYLLHAWARMNEPWPTGWGNSIAAGCVLLAWMMVSYRVLFIIGPWLYTGIIWVAGADTLRLVSNHNRYEKLIGRRLAFWVMTGAYSAIAQVPVVATFASVTDPLVLIALLKHSNEWLCEVTPDNPAMADTVLKHLRERKQSDAVTKVKAAVTMSKMQANLQARQQVYGPAIATGLFGAVMKRATQAKAAVLGDVNTDYVYLEESDSASAKVKKILDMALLFNLVDHEGLDRINKLMEHKKFSEDYYIKMFGERLKDKGVKVLDGTKEFQAYTQKLS